MKYKKQTSLEFTPTIKGKKKEHAKREKSENRTVARRTRVQKFRKALEVFKASLESLSEERSMRFLQAQTTNF